MVYLCTLPDREERLCEHFGGYKTINQILLPLEGTTLKYYLHLTPSPLESNQLDIPDLKYGTHYLAT